VRLPHRVPFRENEGVGYDASHFRHLDPSPSCFSQARTKLPITYPFSHLFIVVSVVALLRCFMFFEIWILIFPVPNMLICEECGMLHKRGWLTRWYSLIQFTRTKYRNDPSTLTGQFFQLTRRLEFLPMFLFVEVTLRAVSSCLGLFSFHQILLTRVRFN
jgi:hypothetical protein